MIARENADGAGTGLSRPRLTTTVPREYVHRASHAEVFLTGCVRTGEMEFTLAGQWPRAHTFFTGVNGCHDPLQAAETVRQTGLFLAHSEFGVPLTHRFLMWDFGIVTQPEHMAIGRGPSEFALKATCDEIVRRGNRLAEFRMAIAIERDGMPCATGGGRFSCLPEGVYQRLRRRALPASRRPTPPAQPPRMLAPVEVGRLLPADVVLAPVGPPARPGRWLLAPQPEHPVLFEHTGDHFPGMVLLEAARQAATALCAPASLVPMRLDTVFHQYAEFEPEVLLEATALPVADDTVSVRVVGTQNDAPVFTSVVSGTLAHSEGNHTTAATG